MSDGSDLDEGELMMFPITDVDSNDNINNSASDADDEQEGTGPKDPNKYVKFSLRQRRRSHNALMVPLQLKLNLNAQFNANGINKNTINETSWNDNILHSKSTNILKQKSNLNIIPQSPTAPSFLNDNIIHGFKSPSKKRWLKALKKIKAIKDPWETFHIDDLEEETAIRHRYNALNKKWITDEVKIKVERKAFNHGAMRECFRLKKLSSLVQGSDWKRAMNYVAKSYMEEVDREVYFEDVRLQMDAKLWGEEYNRHNPPKKVDIFQMSILEFKNRTGSPLFHLEHFIEGHYIKYNSNSGFVEETARLTPQAFSHFTFERSGHQVIIVDIQGVGDLWTDPQIHTADGTDYGDGNLGTKGMALFFYSHVCNSICDSLHLTPFDLAPSETIHQGKFRQLQLSSMTVVRGTEEMCISASPCEREDLTGFLMRNRIRTISSNSLSSCSESIEEYDEVSMISDSMDDPVSPSTGDEEEPMSTGSDSITSPMVNVMRRLRFRSESESDKDTLSREEEARQFSAALDAKHRPSSIGHEINLRALQNLAIGDSVLGQIHHDMAKYYELGRFSLCQNDIDWEAAEFHEKNASELGVLEAILTMAKIHLQLSHNVLADFSVQDTQDNRDVGVEYMLMAAHAGDRESMMHMARAYETGDGLSSDSTRSWIEAVRWYEEAANKIGDDESGAYDSTMDNPVYQIKAKIAEMCLEGGFGFGKDPSRAGDLYTEAAEGAMEAMKGRLANKYYMLAEEAWGQVEEDEVEE